MLSIPDNNNSFVLQMIRDDIQHIRETQENMNITVTAQLSDINKRLSVLETSVAERTQDSKEQQQDIDDLKIDRDKNLGAKSIILWLITTVSAILALIKSYYN